MPHRHPARLLLLAVLLAVGLSAPAHAAVTCDRYVGPFGSDSAPGTLTQPYKSPQKLANVLQAGQTGCLLDGTYSSEVDGPYILNMRHGGAPGAPLTIRSAPGQRAKLRGIIYLWDAADYVTLSDMDIDGRRPVVDPTADPQPTSIGVNASYTIFERLDITNNGNAICSVLGSPGWGEAVGNIVRENTFHDCGGTDNQLEHSLYIEYTDGVLVKDNLFLRSGTYAIHFYPLATNTTVTHNVMADNGGGVIFAGEGDAASNNNVVTKNVIAGSYRKPGIHSWWGTAVGTGNVAKDNCVYNPRTNVDLYYGGFVSQNNVIASPGFRDPADGDYRLAANSPCLNMVGYDTAAKLQGIDPTPSPTPTPTATTVPVTSTPSPTATATTTAAPTQTPAPTTTPVPTATPAPSAAPVETSAPVVPAEPTPPAGAQDSAEATDPGNPVEAAVVYVDDEAFSASGGSAKPAPCRPRKAKRCRAVRN